MTKLCPFVEWLSLDSALFYNLEGLGQLQVTWLVFFLKTCGTGIGIFYRWQESRVSLVLNFGWGKFYPTIVIQIGGVELSTQISHVIFLSRRVIQKKLIQNYETFLTLLYKWQIITQKYNIKDIIKYKQLIPNLLYFI